MKKVIILFPYSGFLSGDKREELFWIMVENGQTIDEKPIIVLNKDTENRESQTKASVNMADAFLNDARSLKLDVLKVWSVDTCQMWLAGWGHALDEFPDARRIILLPGDIDEIQDEVYFFNELDQFLNLQHANIIVGDFETGGRFSSKELIDTYGTYPLMANWFPEISRGIHNQASLGLRRPRSEFLNIDAQVLRELLKERKFAYEQTINILIKSWDFNTDAWRFSIKKVQLGPLKDDVSLRQFRGALDQIERTERLLKLLWREINQPPDNATDDDVREFLNEYDHKDRCSNGIKDSARITIRALFDR